MKASLSRFFSAALTGPVVGTLRRARHGMIRRLTGGTPRVQYFHQVDDPYSHLAAQVLPRLAARYDVAIEAHLVAPPSDAAAPDRPRLVAYGRRDARVVAQARGLDFPDRAEAPTPETLNRARLLLAGSLAQGAFIARAAEIGRALWRNDATDLAVRIAAGGAVGDAQAQALEAEGTALRERLGHYLGGMFAFEGEWYWGVDRLHYLERRLAQEGRDREPGAPPIAPPLFPHLGAVPAFDEPPEIELWFSFRSPYSCIAFPRVAAIARHYGARLTLRFILPMVMRGLPVPGPKRYYIMLDTKREAVLHGQDFGKIVDPVGAGAERALAVLHRAIPLGLGEAFAEAGMNAAFARGIDLASDEGLFQVTREIGLSDADTRAALADPSWRVVAEANRAALFEAGLWGAPSFRVNGRAAHWGQDRLWALESDLLACARPGTGPIPGSNAESASP